MSDYYFYKCQRCKAPRLSWGKAWEGKYQFLEMTYECGTAMQARYEGNQITNVLWYYCKHVINVGDEDKTGPVKPREGWG